MKYNAHRAHRPSSVYLSNFILFSFAVWMNFIFSTDSIWFGSCYNLLSFPLVSSLHLPYFHSSQLLSSPVIFFLLSSFFNLLLIFSLHLSSLLSSPSLSSHLILHLSSPFHSISFLSFPPILYTQPHMYSIHTSFLTSSPATYSSSSLFYPNLFYA